MARPPTRLPGGARLSDHVTLGVLTATIPAALTDAVLADTGRRSRRQRRLPARLVVYYVIALALYARAPYGEGLRRLRPAGTDPDLAGKSAITRARARLGADPLKHPFRRVARPCAEPGTPGAWHRGRRLVSLDGTTIGPPDAPALEKHRRRDEGGTTVRVIDCRLAGVPGAEPLYRLLTTLLDPAAAPAAEPAALYHERWESEGAFAEPKVGPPGERLMLRSRRADLAEQELYGLPLAHFALRRLIHAASGRAGCATRTRRPSSMRCGSCGGACRSTPPFPPRRRRRLHELILIEILAVPAERGRGRHNPRVVKREMSGYRTEARAAPAPGRVFRYAEHIRVVAPAGSPADQASATDRASQEQAEEASTEEGLSADRPSALAGACPRLAGQRPGACCLLRAPRPEPACLPSVGRTARGRPSASAGAARRRHTA